MFDPWTADVDAVVAAQIAAESDGPGGRSSWRMGSSIGPLRQWRAAQSILQNRSQVEKAGGRDLLEAVDACLRCRLVAPQWLADAFADSMRSIHRGDAFSWDDAAVFGRPFPKGAHKATVREEYEKAYPIYRAVSLAKEEDGRAIDKNLFDEIGDRFGLGATRTEELYRIFARSSVDPWEENYSEACRRLAEWDGSRW